MEYQLRHLRNLTKYQLWHLRNVIIIIKMGFDHFHFSVIQSRVTVAVLPRAQGWQLALQNSTISQRYNRAFLPSSDWLNCFSKAIICCDWCMTPQSRKKLKPPRFFWLSQNDEPSSTITRTAHATISHDPSNHSLSQSLRSARSAVGS